MIWKKHRNENGEVIERRSDDSWIGKLASLWPILLTLLGGLVAGITSYVSLRYQVQDHDVRITRIENSIGKIDDIKEDTEKLLHILRHKREGDDSDR